MASAGGPHLANITLVFYDFMVRTRPSTEIIAEIRQAVADIPGAEIKVEREKEGPPTGCAGDRPDRRRGLQDARDTQRAGRSG